MPINPSAVKSTYPMRQYEPSAQTLYKHSMKLWSYKIMLWVRNKFKTIYLPANGNKVINMIHNDK